MRNKDYTDLVNKQIWELTVVEHLGLKDSHHLYRCICSCGKEKVLFRSTLLSDTVYTCGHLKRSLYGHTKTHGMTASPTYITWMAMKQRCYDVNRGNYKYYGKRGIKVCDRWVNSFINFLKDMGERPNGMSIERINNDGNYEPSNCRWATPTEQVRNQRRKGSVL